MTYIKRAAEDTIARISKMFPVLLVTGPRQVGKTTLLQRLAEIQRSAGIERKYVTLDDPDVRYLANGITGLSPDEKCKRKSCGAGRHCEFIGIIRCRNLSGTKRTVPNGCVTLDEPFICKDPEGIK